MSLVYDKDSVPFDAEDEVKEFLETVFVELRDNLEKAKNTENSLDARQRGAHSVKGTCMMLGFDEEWVNQIKAIEQDLKTNEIENIEQKLISFEQKINNSGY